VALLVAESSVSRPGLNLCTETDKIEVMIHEQMQEHLKEIERSYSGVTRYTYGVDSTQAAGTRGLLE
jgi:hypothetical protein